MELKKMNPYMRLLFLFSFFAISAGDAFNVLYIRDMAADFAKSGEQELFTSIPVTAMSAMMIVGVGISNDILRHTKNFTLFIRFSLLVTFFGMLIRGLAFHYLLMVLGFSAVGFGYGCFYIGIRYYAYLFRTEKDRMEAMAYIGGGAFAGQCMGMILGGILGGQIPYRMVYLLAVLLLFPAYYLCMKYPLTAEIDVGQIRDTLRVLKSRNTVRYLIEIVLPLFAANIFMSYLVPLEIDGFGYSSVMISALLLGAYLIAAYAGPAVTGFVTKMMRPGTASYVYCLGVAVLLTVYGIWKTFGVLVVVVLLLGFMDSFGPSVMTGAYTELNNKDGIRSSGSILVYMIATRIGMTIAPTMLVVSGTPFVLPFCIFAGVILYAVSSYWIRRKEVLLRDE